jgi:hypothetical protein
MSLNAGWPATLLPVAEWIGATLALPAPKAHPSVG